MVAGYFITVPYLVGGGIVTVMCAYPVETLYVGKNIYDVFDPGIPSTPAGMATEVVKKTIESRQGSR